MKEDKGKLANNNTDKRKSPVKIFSFYRRGGKKNCSEFIREHFSDYLFKNPIDGDDAA